KLAHSIQQQQLALRQVHRDLVFQRERFHLRLGTSHRAYPLFHSLTHSLSAPRRVARLTSLSLPPSLFLWLSVPVGEVARRASPSGRKELPLLLSIARRRRFS